MGVCLHVLCAAIFIITSCGAAEPPVMPERKLVAPLDGTLSYPFTKDESIRSGRWRRDSQDYPYFGAPRENNRRRHAGVDLYPKGGAGSPVRALADGVVIKTAPFYRRADGEVTYGVLVDHGDLVVNYAELMKPGLEVGTAVRQGQALGRVSGTKQLHLELYSEGTTDWVRWSGRQPDNLLDPTGILLRLFDQGDHGSGASRMK